MASSEENIPPKIDAFLQKSIIKLLFANSFHISPYLLNFSNEFCSQKLSKYLCHKYFDQTSMFARS